MRAKSFQELLVKVLHSFLLRAFSRNFKLSFGFLLKFSRKMRKKKKISKNFDEIPSGFNDLSQGDEENMKRRRELRKNELKVCL